MRIERTLCSAKDRLASIWICPWRAIQGPWHDLAVGTLHLVQRKIALMKTGHCRDEHKRESGRQNEETFLELGSGLWARKVRGVRKFQQFSALPYPHELGCILSLPGTLVGSEAIVQPRRVQAF